MANFGKLLFLSGIMLVFCHALYSQKENNIWYFGEYGGLSFNTSPPTPLYDGKLSTGEGSACASDEKGNLLFYTDGVTVWNKKHDTIATGLKGNESCTQSAVIVKKPGSTGLYYIFTPGTYGKTGGVHYSVLDMAANSGLGGIIEKNTVLISANATEKLIAVKDALCKGYWIICHPLGSRDYYSYHLTATGIDAPVISATGTAMVAGGYDAIGYMKAAPDGSKIAVCIEEKVVEISSFNSYNGKLSQTFSFAIGNSYSCTFSPNGRLFYISTYNPKFLYQFDVSLSTVADIVASQTVIYDGSALANGDFGAMQIGPDSKIYISRFSRKSLSIINNPDIKGPGCNFADVGIVFAGNVVCRLGLPNCAESYTGKTTIDIGPDTIVCGKELYLKAPKNTGLTYEWSTEEKKDSIRVTTNGKYWVKAKTGCGEIADTIEVKFIKETIPPIWLGNDTVVCGTKFPLLVSQFNDVNYLWNTGDTVNWLIVTKTGQYWVKVENYCYKRSDTINIELVQDTLKPMRVGNDTMVCGPEIVLDAGYFYKAKYHWNRGDTTQTIKVTQSGTYAVLVTTYGCNKKLSDTAKIKIFITRPIGFPADTTICEHRFTPFTLNPNGDYNSYLWQDGSRNPKFMVNNAGIYWLQVHDTCGNNYTDSIIVTIDDCRCDLFVPNSFTPNGDGLNDLFYIDEYCGLSAYYIRIFNRWGELLFSSTDPNATWDGTFSGKPAPQDVYMVIIHYNFAELGKRPDYRGTVTLLR